MLWYECLGLCTGIFVSYLSPCACPLCLNSFAGSSEPVCIAHLFHKPLFLPSYLLLSKWLSLSQAEKKRLEEALNTAQEEEGSLAAAKRALEARLEEAQRGLARLGQEQQALKRALEEEGKQREALRRGKAELEEQKRLLDKTVCQLNKEVWRGVARALRKRRSSFRSLPEQGRRSECVVFAFLKFIAGEAKAKSSERVSFLFFLCALDLPSMSHFIVVLILGECLLGFSLRHL